VVKSAQHQALQALWNILVRELDVSDAADVLLSIALDEARAEEPAVDPAYWVWRSGWRYLSRLRPDAFAIDPRRIQPFRPLEFAFVYGLKSEAEVVRPLELAPNECLALQAGRDLLREWTGLRSFRLPCKQFVIGDDSGAGAGLTLARFENVLALSMDRFRGLRRTIAFREHTIDLLRQQDPSGVALAALVLHEEMHVALNVACGRRLRDDQPLVRVVEEVTALAVEEEVRRALGVAGTAIGTATVCGALINLLALGGTERAIAATTELAVTAAMSASDTSTARLLNRTAGRHWSSGRWRRELASITERA